MRLVHFEHEDGTHEWLGTYTAYNGAMIRSELLRTHDFRSFTLAPMGGPAARNKGMALFPRKVGGDYIMIGRQDGENVFIIRSDRIDHWGEGEILLTPKYPWEMVQLGNCGSPIEIDEGWLLLTHGVGAMRKYSIGAILLDKADPSKIIGRMPQSFAVADGYRSRGLCAQRRLYVWGDAARRSRVHPLWRGRQFGRLRVRADREHGRGDGVTMLRRLLAVLALACAGAVHAKLPVAAATIVHVYPHDPDAFTEGLLLPRRHALRKYGL